MTDTKKTSMWSWKMSPEEREEQVRKYSTLKITESYRGIAVLFVGALLLLSLVISFFGIYFSPSDIIVGLVIYAPILFFVYKGHRWAIIVLMIFWTIEKIYTLYLSTQSGGTPITSILWWLILMPYLFKALQVENARKNPKNVIASDAPGFFCMQCGTKQDADAKFCTKCGTQLAQPNL